jgi:hypothetical protein
MWRHVTLHTLIDWIHKDRLWKADFEFILYSCYLNCEVKGKTQIDHSHNLCVYFHWTCFPVMLKHIYFSYAYVMCVSLFFTNWSMNFKVWLPTSICLVELGQYVLIIEIIKLMTCSIYIDSSISILFSLMRCLLCSTWTLPIATLTHCCSHHGQELAEST